MLHALYSKRFSDHAPGHFPSPSAFRSASCCMPCTPNASQTMHLDTFLHPQLLLSQTSGASISQRFMLHALYSKRFSDHAPGHFPSPSAFTFTNFWRFRVPPSQSFEHQDHFVHSLSSQSFSQLCTLHAFD